MNRHRNNSEQNENNESLGIILLEFVVPILVPERVREEFIGDLLEEWSTSVVPLFGKLRAFA